MFQDELVWMEKNSSAKSGKNLLCMKCLKLWMVKRVPQLKNLQHWIISTSNAYNEII